MNKIEEQDYIGKTYGRLTILDFEVPKSYNTKRGIKKYSVVSCICSCGKSWIGQLNNLKTGHTESCGCLKIDFPNHKTHGLTKSSEYKAWQQMQKRCLNPNDISYHNYGGRGITICDEWIESFENFIRDMGQKPSSKHSLDRINSDGNYQKDNCKWSTKLEQANNQRNNKIIKYKDESKTLQQWSRELNINSGTLKNRLVKLNWSIEEAFETPVRTFKK